MNINELIIKNYNEIFKNVNTEVEDTSVWYHNFFGSYGAQEIKVVNNTFHIVIITHSEVKNIFIPFETMIERIYLYDKYFLEGTFMFSYNSDKMSDDMKRSPSTDGFYLLLNDDNRDKLAKRINEELKEEYQNSLEFYNRGIQRNKNLPEAPKFSMETMFDEVDSNKYKSNYEKPREPKEISLKDVLVLETFT